VSRGLVLDLDGRNGLVDLRQLRRGHLRLCGFVELHGLCRGSLPVRDGRFLVHGLRHRPDLGGGRLLLQRGTTTAAASRIVIGLGSSAPYPGIPHALLDLDSPSIPIPYRTSL
jgi:hypothetical protein